MRLGGGGLRLRRPPLTLAWRPKLTPMAPQAVAAAPLEQVQRRGGEYVSAFPNVGLVLWQAGFVLAEWLIRRPPAFVARRPRGWAGARVLELGCGVGQLGVPLACTGAAVTLTDLPHIVGLTGDNVAANLHAMPIAPRVMPFVWGATSPAVLGYGDIGGGASGGDGCSGGGDACGGSGSGASRSATPAAGVPGSGGAAADPHAGPLDLLVAADVRPRRPHERWMGWECTAGPRRMLAVRLHACCVPRRAVAWRRMHPPAGVGCAV